MKKIIQITDSHKLELSLHFGLFPLGSYYAYMRVSIIWKYI